MPFYTDLVLGLQLLCLWLQTQFALKNHNSLQHVGGGRSGPVLQKFCAVIHVDSW
jgi:hypothetical protein